LTEKVVVLGEVRLKRFKPQPLTVTVNCLVHILVYYVSSVIVKTD